MIRSMPMIRTALLLALLSAHGIASAAPWTYRGSLNDGGKPANGKYDLRLTLLDESGKRALGQPVTLVGVAVRNGSFATDVDFGMDLSYAPAMRLRTEVAQGGGGFMALGEPTRFDPKLAASGVCWDTQGNTGTNPATDFVGTIDSKPLVIRAFNVEVGRFGVSSGFASIGLGLNASASGQRATVGGGDFNTASGTDSTSSGGFSNTASGSGSFVGGGSFNTASAQQATVAGGGSNTASGTQDSTVGGGAFNDASGIRSTIAGGKNNTAAGDSATVGGGFDNDVRADF